MYFDLPDPSQPSEGSPKEEKRDSIHVIHAKMGERHHEESEREMGLVEFFSDLPGIVKYHKVQGEGESRSYIQEYCEGGNLTSYLKEHPMSMNHILSIFIKLMKTVVRMHERGVTHNDLKLDNFFVRLNEKKEFQEVAIGDLGLARVKEEYLKPGARTNFILAPPEIFEYLLGKRSAEDVFPKLGDAWQWGLILFQLVFSSQQVEAHLPFLFGSHQTTKEVMAQKLKQQKRIFKKAPDDPQSLVFLIWSLLRPDPADRFTVIEAIEFLEQKLKRG